MTNYVIPFKNFGTSFLSLQTVIKRTAAIEAALHEMGRVGTNI